MRVVGIIRRGRVIGAEVGDRIAHPFEGLRELFLQLEASMVAGDENLFGHVSLASALHLFGHCGQVRTMEPTALIRCSARRSAATYVGILSSVAIENTRRIVS